jgi:adenylate kinase family enzyme
MSQTQFSSIGSAGLFPSGRISDKKRIRCRGLILGASGVGKGYGLGQPLQEYCGGEFFVSGDWCRTHQAEQAASGVLVTDESILTACQEHFEKIGCPDLFFFDCPRTVLQVKSLLGWFQSIGTDEVVAFHMRADWSVCEERIRDRAKRQGRLDDASSDAIKRRLNTYFGKGGILDTVIPFVTDNCNEIIEIDANPDLEVVRSHVIEEHCPRFLRVST